MPEKKGLISTVKERWRQFQSLGKKKEDDGERVPQGRAYRNVRPQPNPEQRKAAGSGRKYRIRVTRRVNQADQRRSGRAR